MNSIESIYEKMAKIQVSSQQMHNYINDLSENEYALIATLYILGRSGWERNYENNIDVDIYIEEKASEGVSVNQKMLDDHFLTNSNKKKQFNINHEHEKSNMSKVNGVYRHNWLSNKNNLITEVEKGIQMMKEIK